jgi:hypothetical protein
MDCVIQKMWTVQWKDFEQATGEKIAQLEQPSQENEYGFKKYLRLCFGINEPGA